MESDVENNDHPTIPISGLPRRGHSLINATSSEWNDCSAKNSSLVNQGSTATFLETTIAIFEDDESQSDYGSEQENQPPTAVPATPPNEPTHRRLQRQPLRQLTIDRNGHLLLTSSSLAAHSPSYPRHISATSLQIDEDEDVDSDAESNASTIMLPNTRKRSGRNFEKDGGEGNSENEDHTTILRPTKRLKTSRPARNDGLEAYEDNVQTSANLAATISLTYTTPSGEGVIKESDSESTASTIVPPPRKRGANHLEKMEDDEEEDGSTRTKMRKRRRAASTREISSRIHELGEPKSQQERGYLTSNRSRHDGRRNLSMPAVGRSKNTVAQWSHQFMSAKN